MADNAPFFHIGILVNDLGEAMERFGDIFKVTWADPAVAEARFWEEGKGYRALTLDVVYSQQGPPYLELLQAQGDGLYGDHHGEGLHHIGVWAADCEGRSAELEAQGMSPVATQFTPEGNIIVSYFNPADLHGVVFEIVDEGRREMMESWIAGEPFVS